MNQGRTVVPSALVERVEERRISGEALLSLAQAALSRGVSFRFKARGGSMSPFIRDGDVVTLDRLGIHCPRLGEVVAFAHPASGRLIVHRVVGRRPGGLVIRGDSLSFSDGVIPPENVLGRVTRVDRHGRAVGLGLGPESRLIALLSRSRLLLVLGAAAQLGGRLWRSVWPAAF